MGRADGWKGFSMAIPKVHFFSQEMTPKNSTNGPLVLSKCLRWKWTIDEADEVPIIVKDAVLVTCTKCLEKMKV